MQVCQREWERKEWDVASEVTKCSQSNHKDTKSKHTVAHAHTHVPPETDESHWSAKWRLIWLIKPRHRKTSVRQHCISIYTRLLTLQRCFTPKYEKCFSFLPFSILIIDERTSSTTGRYWHRPQADWWIVRLGKLPAHRSAVSISSAPAHAALCTACWLEWCF